MPDCSSTLKLSSSRLAPNTKPNPRASGAELTLLRAKCHACAQLRRQSQAEIARLRAEVESFSERLAKSEAEMLTIANRRRQIESELDHLRAEALQTPSELEAMRTIHDAVLFQHAEIRSSLSWRITAPLRRIALLFLFQR